MNDLRRLLRFLTDAASKNPAKKRKIDDVASPVDPDGSILWRVNFDKFHQYARDQLILKLIGNIIDEVSKVFDSFCTINRHNFLLIF